MKDLSTKTSTDYVREFRDRMRRAGLVKKDVWIRPEYSEDLGTIEKKFRLAPGELDTAGLVAGGTAQAGPVWTLATLQQAIEATPMAQSGAVEVRRLEGADPTLHLIMCNYGDLPVFVAVGSLQIIVQAVMWPVDHVVDADAFNSFVLRSHKLVPLSTLGIEMVGGTPCYIMFGSLDTHSSLTNVLFEIETLAENVIASVDAYHAFLRDDVLPAESTE